MARPGDWEKEMAKVDRQLASMTDAQLLATGMPEKVHSGVDLPRGVAAPGTGKAATRLGTYLRLGLALALGVGILFWPYETRCGWGLIGFLGGTLLITGTAVWSGIHSWKTRIPAAHILSIALALWGTVLSTREVLPRVGYALPTAERPAIWMCQ